MPGTYVNMGKLAKVKSLMSSIMKLTGSQMDALTGTANFSESLL